MAAARVLAVAALLVSLGCSAPQRPLEQALGRAEAYFESHGDGVDLGVANLLGYLERRFGLALRGPAGAPLRVPPAPSTRPALDAVFRRLVDPGASVTREQIAGLDSPIDRMTGLALHCDRAGLPADWPDVLGRAAASGGYALTHAALAAQWTLENGCLPAEDLAARRHALVDQLVTLATDPAASHRASTDLHLEALVMLYYLGAGARVVPAWVEAVLALQRADGGWPLRPGAPASHPHPSALALWVLLENLHPGAPRVHWIP